MPPTSDPARHRRGAAVASGWLVATAVAVLWIVLSLRTRLIFHLMPAAPSLGAAFTFRWRTGAGRENPQDPAQLRDVLALLAGALIITTAAALVLARAGHFLDGDLLVAAITLAGAAMSGLWLRGTLARRWTRINSTRRRTIP